MDGNQFDQLARTLAGNMTRRQALRRLVGGAVSGVMAMAGANATRAQPAGKVSICHVNDAGGYDYISVNANAISAHQAHGDLIDIDLQTDPNNCGTCGNACPSDPCTVNVRCVNGACVPGTPKDCSALDNDCGEGVCDAATGNCYTEQFPDVFICGHTDACNPGGYCMFGTCIPMAPLFCEDYYTPCGFGDCDPTTGCFTNPDQPDGASCQTGDGTEGECLAGQCIPI